MEEKLNEEELLEAFVKGCRQTIGKFYAEARKYAEKYKKFCIYYDEEMIYFPTKVFEKILSLNGLANMKAQILLELYARGVLSKDTEGFSKKIAVCGERFEAYHIKRNLFNQSGELEIMSLARREE